jgi:hypothetical protein
MESWVESISKRRHFNKRNRELVGFTEKLLSDDDKVALSRLLESCYKYSIAMNVHVQTHAFPSESLIMTLLLEHHK